MFVSAGLAGDGLGPSHVASAVISVCNAVRVFTRPGGNSGASSTMQEYLLPEIIAEVENNLFIEKIAILWTITTSMCMMISGRVAAVNSDELGFRAGLAHAPSSSRSFSCLVLAGG